jgi:hypothetical protein
MRKKKYPCQLCPDNSGCEYGGNKNYFYGFVSGTAEYCRFKKQWIVHLKECPLENKFKKEQS